MRGRASVAIELSDEERGFLGSSVAQAQGGAIAIGQMPDRVAMR